METRPYKRARNARPYGLSYKPQFVILSEAKDLKTLQNKTIRNEILRRTAQNDNRADSSAASAEWQRRRVPTNCFVAFHFPQHVVEISENRKNGKKTALKINEIVKNVEKCGGVVQKSVEKLTKTKSSQFVHIISTKLPIFFLQNAQKPQKYLGNS